MKKITALLLVSFLILGTTYCSSDSEESKSESKKSETSTNFKASIASAYKNLKEEGSFKIKGSMKMSGKVNGSDFTATSTFEGISSADNKNSQITTNMSDFFAATAGQSLGTSEFLVEQRTVDGILYMKMPDFGFGLGSSWVDYGPFDELTPDQRQQNPAQYLEYLEEISEDVKQVGKEKVDGVDTIRYKGIVDGEVIAGQVRELLEDSDTSEEEIQNAISIYEGVKIPIEVWVDNKDLVRKITISINAKSFLGTELQEGESFKIDFEYVLSDFGIDVDVSAPLAGEVRKLSDIPAGGDGL